MNSVHVISPSAFVSGVGMPVDVVRECVYKLVLLVFSFQTGQTTNTIVCEGNMYMY